MRRKTRHRTARCILYRTDKFLLADHNGRRGPTKWGLPGGHIEWREHPEEAARREILEELNVYLGAMTPVGDYLYKNRLHAVYAAQSSTCEFDLDLSELSAVQWFTQPQIEQLAARNQLHAGYEHEAVRDFLAGRSICSTKR